MISYLNATIYHISSDKVVVVVVGGGGGGVTYGPKPTFHTTAALESCDFLGPDADDFGGPDDDARNPGKP